MSGADRRWEELEARLAAREARVAVVGLGSVGLPLAAVLERAGFDVLGYDRDAERAARVGRGESPRRHLPADLVPRLAASARFEATSDPERLASVDAALVCVPTPLGPHAEPDLSAVEDAASALARHLRPGALVVLESTTWPGSTREVVGGRLEREGGLVPGRDVLLAYSPERVDPGRTDATLASVPKLVGGTCDASSRCARALYAAAFETVHAVSSAEVAESAKLLENVFRAVNIALVNELKVVLEALGVDVWEVVDAAATKPFGFMRFAPGPGLGGHCLPVDPFYLAWVARRAGRSTRFIELAGEINRRMPELVVERCLLALNDRGRAVRGARVLVLGLAYKPEVDVLDESPALALVERLAALGARVRYADPWVPEPPPEVAARLDPEHPRSVDLDADALRASDLVLVATDHAAFDWDLVAAHAPLVVDTRHALATRMRGDARYVSA